MHLGILGIGRIGQMHARHAAGCAQITSLTLYDTDELRAKQLADELGITGSSDLDAVLAAVDAVLIATPTPTHADVVRAALAARVHVLCEKPLAADAATIRDLDRAVPDGVHLVVGFQRRFDPAYEAIRAAIAAGGYGAIYLIRATTFDHVPPDPGYLAASGGIFRDQFIHDLDVLPWLLGERVTTVQATGSVLVDPVFEAADDVDTAAVTLRFESGAIGVVCGGRRNGGGYDNRLEVFAERASVSAGLDEHTPLTSLEPGGTVHAAASRHPHESFMTRWARAYRRELDLFAEVIAGRVENPSPALDGVHALEIAQACELSRRTSRSAHIATDGSVAGGTDRSTAESTPGSPA
jgi:myo-inositol 2-dehydrogenase / D-chiro-inositol 1-dehydrogenase